MQFSLILRTRWMLQEGALGSAVRGPPTLPQPCGGDPPGPPSTIGSVMPGRGSDAEVQSPLTPGSAGSPLWEGARCNSGSGQQASARGRLSRQRAASCSWSFSESPLHKQDLPRTLGRGNPRPGPRQCGNKAYVVRGPWHPRSASSVPLRRLPYVLWSHHGW